MILSLHDLELARKNITHFWDSDFFPKAFEYDAIWRAWTQITNRLTSTDFNHLRFADPRIALAPKPNGTYRVVHQLDPLDSLIYTALVFHAAPFIEAARAPRERRIACSYRISIDEANGNLFASGNCYEDYTEQTRILGSQYRFILYTDITDFYNQIYSHRLQNAVALAHPGLEEVASAIERFLLSINRSVSRGIPVGPPASIVLAEALLTDLDNFIQASGLVHTRYVDDFRIFSNSKSDLEKFLRDFTLYLHNSHRLVLSSHKTKTLDTSTFLESELDDPEVAERRAIHGQLEKMSTYQQFETEETEVTEDTEQLTPEQRAEVVVSLMELICSRTQLDLGLARHILRMCRRLRIRAIIPLLLENISHFAPVMSDVVIYLNSVTNPGFIQRTLPSITAILSNPTVMEMPYVRHWLAHYFASNPLYLQSPEITEFVRNSNDLPSLALASLNSRNASWARELRHRFDIASSFERRHILRASIVMATDERRAFYQNVRTRELISLEEHVLNWASSINI